MGVRPEALRYRAGSSKAARRYTGGLPGGNGVSNYAVGRAHGFGAHRSGFGIGGRAGGAGRRLLVDPRPPRLSRRRGAGRFGAAISQFGDSAWYYVSQDTTQKAFRRPRTKQQTILRVRFDPAGNVAAVDRAAMEKVVRLDPNGDKTPTLGRDRGLLEDLFGNIGTVGAPGMGGGGGSGGGPNGS
jgi:SmpA / OmlA family